jgi:CHAT domain-containing protein/tetratricopeptide (TPR) repeat protein
VRARAIGLLAAGCVALVSIGRAQPPPASVPWEAWRAVADSLERQPGIAIHSPPPYMLLSGALALSMRRVGHARLAGSSAGLDSARTETRLAAGLMRDLYAAPAPGRSLDRLLAMPPAQLRVWMRADSLSAAASRLSSPLQYAEAEPVLRAALRLYSEVGDSLSALSMEQALLRAPASAAEMPARIARLAAIASEAARLGSPGLHYRALRDWAFALVTAGQADSACAVYDEQRALSERLRSPLGVSSSWWGIGMARLHAQRYDEAKDAYRQCLRIASAERDSSLYYAVLTQIAGVCARAGETDSSVSYARRALGYYQRTGDHQNTAAQLYSLCLSHWYSYRFEEAVACCEPAIDEARQSGNWWVEENASNILGNIASDLGDFRRAQTMHERALALARESRDFVMQTYALCNIGLRHARRDSLKLARTEFQSALAAADSIPPGMGKDWDLRGLALLDLAWLDILEGDSLSARTLIEESFDLTRGAPDADLGLTFAGRDLGYVALTSGDLDRAAEGFRVAVEAAQRLHDLVGLREGHTGLAEVAWRRGDRAGALNELDGAITALEEQREDLGSLGLREKWFAEQLSPYDRMIGHRLELGQEDEAFSYFERMKARELLDLLAGGRILASEELSDAERGEEQGLVGAIEELNRRTGAGQTGLDGEVAQARDRYQQFEERIFRLHPDLQERRGRGRPITAAEARRMIAPDEIALLYSLGPAQTTLIAVTRDAIQGRILPAPTPVIRRTIGRMRDSILDPGRRFDRSAAAELYTMLIAPADSLRRGKHRLCVVPDAELYAVPFQALIDPATDSYLIDSCAVYIAPSLSTLGSLRWKGSRGRRDLLALACPDLASGPPLAAAVRGARTPLPFAADEVNAIARVYRPRARALIGAAATESAFKTLAPDYGVIHVATHALFNDENPLYSSILFSPEPDGANDGYLETREVLKMRLDADIVVLSACETARGAVTQGEGISGLLRSFFVAGVPTVVASLWPVEDRSTAALMTDFHQRLRDGDRPADALAEAERALRAREATAHPYYWAPFLLYGDSE